MKRFGKYLLYTVVGIFALIGIAFTAVFIAMNFGLLNVRGSIGERNQFFGTVATTTPVSGCINKAQAKCDWSKTSEWEVIKGGLLKDEAIIARVSRETGVSERMIAAVVVPEQSRFFNDNREVFKRYFEPLKILGSLSQFSLGVSGIKEETAKKIEEYAASSTSPFYPGSIAASLLHYSTTTPTHDEALYARLTDAKNHYYSYLYTALYIREIGAQWQQAGFDVTQNPEVITTLFNIGFQNSHPKAHPDVGGATITVGGTQYTYGQLGARFYFSTELQDTFPR